MKRKLPNNPYDGPNKRVEHEAKPSTTTTSQESFDQVQKQNCNKLIGQISKCENCFNSHGDNSPEEPCQFINFRKLRIIQNGEVQESGFLDPDKDFKTDLKYYLFSSRHIGRLNNDKCKHILKYVIAEFVKTVNREKEYMSGIIKRIGGPIVWTKVLEQQRDSCSVCKTSLFNYHFTCKLCRFDVCCDCLKKVRELSIATGFVNFGKCTQNKIGLKGKKLKRTQGSHQLIACQRLPADVLFFMDKMIKKRYEELEKMDQGNTLKKDQLDLAGGCSHEEFCSWQNEGNVLVLHNATHHSNDEKFKEHWEKGKPLIVHGVDQSLNLGLWNPKYIKKHFGTSKITAINCSTYAEKTMKLADFFGRFGDIKKDKNGKPVLYKVKDWPTDSKFSTTMPLHYKDIMKAMPFLLYTCPNGRFNLISYLPNGWLRVDLGPKLYIASGSSSDNNGTTNLHLDVADAVNVMVYVSQRADEEGLCWKILENANCDKEAIERARKKKLVPGALWHIFDAKDSSKIKEFLRKVAIENGKHYKKNYDPIHAQSIYLDPPLLKRLHDEYKVTGYAIMQCVGDAIFIPTGCAHQVKNLNDCIKVATDFVSPQNVHKMLELTEQFRNLPDNFQIKGDKLDLKNVIYHCMKEVNGHIIVNHEKSKMEEVRAYWENRRKQKLLQRKK